MLSLLRSSRLLVMALAVCACALLPARAHAVTVSVSPADTTVLRGDTFTIRLTIDAFPDLKAYQLIHHFNPAVLQYQGPTAGDVLTGNGNPYVVSPIADVSAPVDTAWTDCAQLVNSTSGPGVLLYLTFKATDFGISPIECLGVDLRDSLNNTTIPLCASGIVRVVGPVPVARHSWGHLKQAYR
jgi:hypothetical protein